MNILQTDLFFGMPLFSAEGIGSLVFRFIFNLVISVIVIRGIYYPKTQRRDFLFTFLLIGQVIFLMCFVLESVKLQVGFALGLFAVFGIIRYRTMSIPIKEMTYLFIIIGVSVINSLANKKVSYTELLFANGMIVAIAWIVEKLKIENAGTAIVIFEKIELVCPEKEAELIAELEKRMGVSIAKVEVLRLDYQKDIARLQVFFSKDQQAVVEHSKIAYMNYSNESN